MFRTLSTPVLKTYKNVISLDKLCCSSALFLVKIFFPDTRCEGLLFHCMSIFSCPPSIFTGFIFTASSSKVLDAGLLLGVFSGLSEPQFLHLTGQGLQLVSIFVALCSTQSSLSCTPVSGGHKLHSISPRSLMHVEQRQIITSPYLLPGSC